MGVLRLNLVVITRGGKGKKKEKGIDVMFHRRGRKLVVTCGTHGQKNVQICELKA